MNTLFPTPISSVGFLRENFLFNFAWPEHQVPNPYLCAPFRDGTGVYVTELYCSSSPASSAALHSGLLCRKQPCDSFCFVGMLLLPLHLCFLLETGLRNRQVYELFLNSSSFGLTSCFVLPCWVICSPQEGAEMDVWLSLWRSCGSAKLCFRRSWGQEP